MATYYFKCSICEKSVSARSKYYKRYLGKYDCDTPEELSRYYVCKICRKKRGEIINKKEKLNLDLNESPKFGEVQGYISLEAQKLKQIGLHNPSARQMFLENVKAILERNGIKEYNFVIENNDLKGVSLKMPFVGEVIMRINPEEVV